MKKLNLKLDSLEVESFTIGSQNERPGTVHGYVSVACPNSYAPEGSTCDGTCQCSNGCNTWDAACGGPDTLADCTKACPGWTVEGYTCGYVTCNVPYCTNGC